jgi:predicted ATPase/class 3 adenylate cyclase
MHIPTGTPVHAADAAPTLTLTVVVDGTQLSMALSDAQAMGHIASCSINDEQIRTLQASKGHPFTQGAILFEQLFPARIRNVLQHSASRAIYLQLDESLLAIPWEMAFDGKQFLGEKFQITRRVLSGAPPKRPSRAATRRESLRVLLLRGPHCTPDQESYCATLAESILFIEGLEATLVHTQTVEPTSLLKLVHDSDVVHSIGSGDTLHVTSDHQEASNAAQLWISSCGSSHINMLRHGANVLIHQDVDETTLHIDGMRAFYQALAQGSTLGAAVQHARHNRPHQQTSTEAPPWTCALYGDAALVLHPSMERAGLDDNLRQVTAVSCDLVGSTHLLDTWGAERYSEVLDTYHTVCAGVVSRWGGISDTPQGDDGIMCYFGVPLAYEDSVARALRAGLEILQTVIQLGVQVRLGVVTGNVVVRSGQPFGVSLHLAARLQSVAQPNTMVASDSTRQIVKEKFIFEQLTSLPPLKGFAPATAAYRVVSEVPNGSQVAQESAPRRTPFVGRNAELSALKQHWSEINSQGVRAVMVSGEAGIGKSRLASEFRRSLQARKLAVLECRCTPDHVHSTFHPLIDFLRRQLRIADEESPDSKLHKIHAHLPENLLQTDAQALIAALLSIPMDGRLAALSYTKEKQRERTLDVLVAWLLHATQRGPVCLLMEDLQWVDPSTREFLHRAMAEAAQRPLLVLLTLRTEQSPVPDTGFAVHEIPLKGLSPESTRAMILGACGPSAVPGEMVQLLAAKADGVPLFIEESARMVMDLGVQAHSHDAAMAARFTVPATIHDLLMARLDRLATAKQVAQVGATIGREFSLPLLQAIVAHETSPIGLHDLPARLAALVRSGLVIETNDAAGTHYYFKHALVRDAAYESLWERDRKRLHRTIANVVREQFQDLAQSQPELLAHHFAQSGNDAQALEYWERAARRAATRSAHLEAINHLRSGLAVLLRLPPVSERDRAELRLQLLLAGQLIATHGYGADQVGHAYERAAELCQRVGDETAQMKTLLGLEGYHFMRADFNRAHEIAQQAANLIGEAADPMRKIQVQWAAGNILFHKGDFVASLAHLDACLTGYRQLQHHPSVVQDPGIMSLCYSAWAVWELGLADQALERARQAVALAEQLGHKFSMGEAFAFCASIHLFRGEITEAMHCAKQAKSICQEGGFAVWLAYSTLLHGRLLAELGDPEAGVAEMQQAYRMWVSTGAVVTRPLYLAMQAEGLALAGKPDEGLALLYQAFEIVCQYQEHYHEAEIRRLTGELLLQSAGLHGQDRYQEAEQWLQGALDFARNRQHRAAALRCATSLSKLCIAQGQHTEAKNVLKAEYDVVSEGFYTRDVQVAGALLEPLLPAEYDPFATA